ncbi:MAG TPA: PilZ domain-containing protein [Myxococcota bacterium]|jgi:c-di-GMP-binding flagellar brake protein YcgR|nr:PilZ domain-containing protein [Myxococcota bacterium]
MATPFELRAHARYARKVDVRVTVDGQELRGRTRDMSLGGMHAELPGLAAEVKAGSEVQLAFRVQPLRDEVRVPATVRWVQRDAGGVVGVGLRFAGLGRVQQWGLNKFFTQEPS